MIKTCKQVDFEEDLQTVCNIYQDDFVKDNLQAELKTFGAHFHQNWKRPFGGDIGSLTIFDVKDHFLSLTKYYFCHK